MVPLGNLLFRIVALLHVGLLPIVAPLDVRATTIRADASVRLTGSAVVLLAGLALVGWASRRTKLGSALLAASLVGAAVGSYVLTGDRGPLGRGAPWISPPLWIALACIVFAALAPIVDRPWLKDQRIAALAGAGVSGLLLLTALPRLESREAMWADLLRHEPGNEVAAVQVALARERAGKPDEALEVYRGCLRAAATACVCRSAMMRVALAAEQPKEVLSLFDGATAPCDAQDDVVGMRAEAMLATRNLAGIEVATAVLGRSPRQPHALMALALGDVGRGDSAAALLHARQSFEAGRGGPAKLLMAVASIALGDLDGARRFLEELLVVEPANAKARYNLALVADRKLLYREAREGYLAALRLDPKLVDARYNLAVLTLRNGAKAEAQHHVDKLAELAPNDPRLVVLRTLLGAP